MSKQRDLILKIIHESKLHLSAEDILKEASKEMPNISLGTVYRNLNYLVSKGLITRFHTGLGKDYYDCNTTPHGHLICKVCDSIKDYDVKYINNHIKGNIKNLISFELEINYICEKCQKNLEKEGDY